MDLKLAHGLFLLLAGLASTPALAADHPSSLQFVQYAEPGGRQAGPPPIQLLNDPESGGVVAFLVNGREYSLEPGESLDLPNDQVQTVDFNSGASAGDRRFSLYSGLYKFKVGADGWMLFKSSSPPTRTAARPPAVGSANSGPTPPTPAPDLARRKSSPKASSQSPPAAGAASSPPANGELKNIPQPPEPKSPAEDSEASIAVPRRNAPPEDAADQPAELKAPAAEQKGEDSSTPPSPQTPNSSD